jgi:flagellar basal body-associated protein FliL
MEGGVALFLLFILIVIAAVVGIVMYLGGGALIFKSDREKKDAPGPRPEHEEPTSPTQENVTFAGTRQDDRVDD